MSEISLTEFSQFLDRFRPVASVEDVPDLDTLQNQFIRLKEEFLDIQQIATENALVHATGFNVFSVLGLSRAENRTHSAMLANLLSPYGDHGQQYLFLEKLIDYCHEKYPDFPKPSEDLKTGHWEVITELPIPPLGRMDIVIRSPDLNYLCVIENKVDAYEHQEQLVRYGKWLDKQRQFYPDQALFFLTIDGHKSNTARELEYWCLSYHDDIADWLFKTLDYIQAPTVSVIVQQYIDLIKAL